MTPIRVADLGVDLPQPVAARIDVDVDAAAVLELSLGRGRRQSHENGPVGAVSVGAARSGAVTPP